MSPLRIFVDFVLPPDALALLQEGTHEHALLFARTPATSVLANPERDPQFATADVAFGQPDPEAVAVPGPLKWIQINTSGITRYDNAEFRALVARRGIPVSNSASVYNEACATHALSFILAQNRQLSRALATRTPGGADAWHGLRATCPTLAGQTVLILGYGAIGSRLAAMLAPLGVRVVAYRRRPRGDEGVPTIGPEQLPAVLAHEADHIVNLLPDSAETRHFFNRARLATLKPGAVFYNIGRGTTVDQEALLDALREDRLAAAWLDVTDPEPLPAGHPLTTHPRCFITPHVAGGHTGEALTLVRHFLANLNRYTRGEPLLDRVM